MEPLAHDRVALLKRYLAVAPISRAVIRSKEIELIAAEGLEGSRVIDLGHGDGIFAEILRESGVTVHVGLDMSFETLKLAKGRGAKHLVVGDMEHLPFRRGVFDGVLSNCVLEHVDDIAKVLSEMRRIARGGAKIVSTIVTDRYKSLLYYPTFFRMFGIGFLAEKYEAFIDSKFAHKRYPSIDEWKKIFAAAALTDTDAIPYVGSRRQKIMDLFLPFLIPGRLLRNIFGREVLLTTRIPAGMLSRFMEETERSTDETRFANVLFSVRTPRAI